MFRLCIWMDVPSHYQSAFFAALEKHKGVDLQVCYTQKISGPRADQGWRNTHDYKPFENNLAGVSKPQEQLDSVPDWSERIHIVSTYISRDLVEFFCAGGVRWCHWSEAPGVRLAEAVGYRMGLFRILYPLMLILKRPEGKRIAEHALAAFGQGDMASRAFLKMGVPPRKLSSLYYAPDPLVPMEASRLVKEFAQSRKVFLSVGALCKRKGIDILLKAFSRNKTDEWCLVLCGLDKAAGKYQALAERLGLRNRVLFLGAYPIERISEVYAAADVFILASRFDGWGAVLNEAASLGLPLIATDLCGASWHIIEVGKNGFRVKAGSVESLRHAIADFIHDPSQLKMYSAASREIFFDEFTPERNSERLISGIMTTLEAC